MRRWSIGGAWVGLTFDTRRTALTINLEAAIFLARGSKIAFEEPTLLPLRLKRLRGLPPARLRLPAGS